MHSVNPSPDRRMVDLQASLDQQLLDITVRKGVAQVPTAQRMTSAAKCRHLKIASRWGLAMIGKHSRAPPDTVFATHPSGVFGRLMRWVQSQDVVDGDEPAATPFVFKRKLA